MNPQEAMNILGLNRDHTEDDIKKAFKSKAHEHHPDKGGDSQMFIRVKEAKEVLLSLRNGGHNRDNLFETLFGRKKPFSTYTRPKVRIPEVVISLQRGYFGGQFTKKLRVQKPCKTCGGLGRTGDYCSACNGNGFTKSNHAHGPHNIFTRNVCGYCGGTGFADKCSDCKGLGVYETTETLEFQIPSGTVNSTVLSAKGEFHHKIRVHVDIPDDYKVFPGKILYMPNISLEKVIRGYDLEVLGKEVSIDPFTFNEIDINEDIMVRPQIYVENKELFADLLND
jgi:molecular chaperone DnaJ